MDRRLFLALAGGLAVTPWPVRAIPSVPAQHRVSLVNAHTGESFDGAYRDAVGPIPSAMDELSHLLRDNHSGHRIAIDVEVIDFLAAVMAAVGVPRASILSAYRTPETNAMLARTTFGVAENSQHLYGRALDVRLDGRLEEAMQAARRMQRGGVGWYPRSGFFHIDTGPVRNWTLDGQGFDHLLLQLHDFLARRGLSTAQQSELIAGRARHPLSVRQRLALHHELARAEYLAHRH